MLITRLLFTDRSRQLVIPLVFLFRTLLWITVIYTDNHTWNVWRSDRDQTIHTTIHIRWFISSFRAISHWHEYSPASATTFHTDARKKIPRQEIVMRFVTIFVGNFLKYVFLQWVWLCGCPTKTFLSAAATATELFKCCCCTYSFFVFRPCNLVSATGLSQHLHFQAYLISCMYKLHVFAQQMARLFKSFTKNWQFVLVL